MDIGPVYQEQWYQKCDLIMSSLANLPYCGVGEVGESFNPQNFSNIWKNLIISIKFKKYFFSLKKLQFLNHPSGISCISMYEYAPLKEVMPYIYYQIIPKLFVI